jgi:hypothetical protein
MKSLGLIGFLQALGTLAYCGLVALIFWRGSQWFGQAPNYWGPFLFLLLFAVSALICGLLVFAYPTYLVLDKKKQSAFKLVSFTVGWLIAFTLLFITGAAL